MTMQSQMITIEKLANGWAKGEMMVISAGRQTGKSYYQKMMLNQLYNANLCKEITLTGQKLLQEYTIMWGNKPVSKYKFSRANWYQAEFDDRHYFEVDAWCSQQFGPHPANPDAWSRWWHKFHNSILFRDEKDYVLFMLRWS